MGVFLLVSNPSKLEYYKFGLLSSWLLGDFHLPEVISKVILMKYLIMSALLFDICDEEEGSFFDT
jgi:hypothetical protein